MLNERHQLTFIGDCTMVSQKCKFIMLFIPLSFICGTRVQLHAITIAQNGIAQAVIVIATDAPEPEHNAALELADFLRQITGTGFEVVHGPAVGKSRLLVGPKAAKLAIADFSTDGLGAEGIIIRNVGNDLILAGGYPRGTLYAVYTFLEDQLGCRWWSSTVSTIPKKPTLKVGKLNVRYIPPLEYRNSFWYDAFNADWAARNKSNGGSDPYNPISWELGPKQGGKIEYEGWCHTFYYLIPPEKYFKDHPEWYSLIDGKRGCTHNRSQLCLTNEEMRKELVKNLKENLRKNPTATIASVSQNDGWAGNCQCPRCAAIDKKEGSPSGSLLRFVNAVAADIEEEFPHVAISTLAYVYSMAPPKHVKPRSNVIIRLCSYECSFSRPLNDPLAHEENKKFCQSIAKWSKICNRLYIWDYTTNFLHYMQPFPNLRVLGPNIKFFVNHNVKGIFEQGNAWSYGGEMAELRAWVLAKLLWNPSLDGQKLINEFVHNYYGPAAEDVLAYLNLIHDAAEKSGDKLGIDTPPDDKFLSFDTLSKGMKLLKAAEQTVKDDPELCFRVQVAQLPLIYVFMMRWDELRDKAKAIGADWRIFPSIQEAFDQFLEIGRRKRITHFKVPGYGERCFEDLRDAVKRAKK